MTQDNATAAPVCYRHPDRHTLLRCSRCERPICASCSIDASVGQRCPECMRAEGPQKVIPTRPTARSRAPMTLGIIAVTAAFYVLASIPALREPMFTNLAQINALVAAGEWWRIFTPILLHSGSITDFPFGQLHIVFNMWALWVLGPQIERGVGKLPFLGAYIASAGVGGAFLYFMGDPTSAAVGASGAIFGLFGIWLNWALRRRNTMQGRLLLRQILVLLAVNAALPFLIRGIAWEAHLGGLIAGFVIGELWARVRGPRTTALRFGITAVVAALAAVVVMVG